MSLKNKMRVHVRKSLVEAARPKKEGGGGSQASNWKLKLKSAKAMKGGGGRGSVGDNKAREWVLAYLLSEESVLSADSGNFAPKIAVIKDVGSSSRDGQSQDEDEGGEELQLANVKPGDILPANSRADEIDDPPEDFTHLPHLNEPAAVMALRSRFAADKIYTSTGSSTVIALNPFKMIHGMYGQEVMEKYIADGEKRGEDQEAKLSPHVYTMTDSVFRDMMAAVKQRALEMAAPPRPRNQTAPKKPEMPAPSGARGRRSSLFRRVAVKKVEDDLSSNDNSATETLLAPIDQSILISGESGSGKTMSARYVLRYISALSQRRANVNAQTEGRPARRSTLVQLPARTSHLGHRSSQRLSWQMGALVETKIVEANPILESFGNARTCRNDNSSRFGRYVDLQFNEKGILIGAHIETHLLERVRLCHVGEGERSYHIFYQMLAGSTDEERELYQLGEFKAEDFKLLNDGGVCTRRDGADDGDLCDELVTSMMTMGFELDEIEEIMKICAACMHHANITFREESESQSSVEDSIHSAAFAKLLGVSNEILEKAVCSRSMRIAQEDIKKPVGAEQAKKSLEALVKYAYSSMFHYIVSFINERIAPKGKTSAGRIGVLDIFGFENFAKNSFEQLCINFCNEVLQQQFNWVVFQSEQDEYIREGIEWSNVSYPDNQECLDTISKRGFGILSVLDDTCLAPKASATLFAKNLYANFKKNPSPRFHAKPLDETRLQFDLHHYAGCVRYDLTDFVEKNKDEAVSGLLEFSSSSFIRGLVSLDDDSTNQMASTNKSKPGRLTSVAGQFTQQLKALRTRIDRTSSHYIRCLKPNQKLVPDDFQPGLVASQLQCMGILEAVVLSRSGFPNRFSVDLFIQRYRALAWDELKSLENEAPHLLCKILVKNFGSKGILSGNTEHDDESGIQIGKSKVFISKNIFEKIENARNQKIDTSVVKIQTIGRQFNAKVTLKRLKEIKEKEEAERILMEQMNSAAIKVQALVRKMISKQFMQQLHPQKEQIATTDIEHMPSPISECVPTKRERELSNIQIPDLEWSSSMLEPHLSHAKNAFDDLLSTINAGISDEIMSVPPENFEKICLFISKGKTALEAIQKLGSSDGQDYTNISTTINKLQKLEEQANLGDESARKRLSRKTLLMVTDTHVKWDDKGAKTLNDDTEPLTRDSFSTKTESESRGFMTDEEQIPTNHTNSDFLNQECINSIIFLFFLGMEIMRILMISLWPLFSVLTLVLSKIDDIMMTYSGLSNTHTIWMTLYLLYFSLKIAIHLS